MAIIAMKSQRVRRLLRTTKVHPSSLTLKRVITYMAKNVINSLHGALFVLARDHAGLNSVSAVVVSLASMVLIEKEI